MEVQGCILPKPVGGHPALDFCNTLAGWGGPPLDKGEWLREPDTLLVWTWFAGLLEDAQLTELRDLARGRPDEARETLTQARRLRSALYATLLHADSDVDAFRVVASAAQRAAAEARLTPLPDGRFEWKLPPALGLELPLLRLAEAGAGLLTSAERQNVRACPGDECGWLFLDRRGRRRWCSMETCGNRAKVKAFAQRRRENKV